MPFNANYARNRVVFGENLHGWPAVSVATNLNSAYIALKRKKKTTQKKENLCEVLTGPCCPSQIDKKEEEGHYYQSELSPAVIAVSSEDELQVRRRNLILYQKDGITAFPPRSSVAVPFLPNPG